MAVARVSRSISFRPPHADSAITPATAPAVTQAQNRFSIATLGCKVNTFESEVIARELTERHYSRVPPNAPADLCLINTCTVTAEADRQARQLVRRMVRNNPNARVVVTGCYAQMAPQACAAIPGVDLVVGNGGKLDIPALLDKLDAGESPPADGGAGGAGRESGLPRRLISGVEGRVRAFVQIQQGCDRGCTFCIIHKARGPNRSFPAAMIRHQVA